MRLRKLLVSLLAAATAAIGFTATTSAPAAAQDVLTPQDHTPDGTFVPLAAPQRFLDTRPGTGGTDSGGVPVGIGGWTGRLGVGQIIDVQIAGRLGVPAATLVKAVAMNVTAVEPSGSGFVTIWPGLVAQPNSSNLNYAANVDVPNFVIVPVGTNGKVNAYNGANDGVARAHLLFDVVGYYTTTTATALGGSFIPFAERYFDTRKPDTFAQRGAGPVNFLAPGQWRTIKDNLYDPQFPNYVFNVTVTQASGNGFLSVVPGRVTSGTPAVSNLNFRNGFDVANLVMVRPNAAGEFSIYNGGTGALHVLFDFVGFYDDGTVIDELGVDDYAGKFVAAPGGPFRFSDSRTNLNKGTQTFRPDGFSVTMSVAADARIPATAVALVVNVTALPTLGNGYLTVYTGPDLPESSTLNFRQGQVIPNLTIVEISESRTISWFVPRGVSLHAFFDVMGWIE